MINIILCGYRSWAKEIFSSIRKNRNVNIIYEIQSNEDYNNLENKFGENIDFILFVGWSWIIPPETTSKYLCLGLHPSDLPEYRGGSPIQNQIIDGILDTKVSLITLSDKLDGGDIWAKESLSLRGNSVNEIFKNLIDSSINLLDNFLNDYSNIKPIKQDINKGTYRRRRTLNESKMSKEDFQKMSLLEIYNKIRCLTDPYPNAYIEDEEGNKLIITGIKYIPKKYEK